MSLFRTLLAVFLLVPLLEIYLLFQAGAWLGILPTITLCVLTAVLGAALLRIQGMETIALIQARLNQGELPALELIGGAILLIAGALLLTPGFFTDCIGFLCLLPRCRRALAALLLARWLRLQTRPGTGSRSGTGGPATVDGEFWEEEEPTLPNGRHPPRSTIE